MAFQRSAPPVRTRAAAPVLSALASVAIVAPAGLAAQGAGLVGPDGSLDRDRYYTSAESDRILAELHALHPGLTELYSIGESFQGRPLMVMEITNEATGPAAEKPALYVDGGIHAAELTGSAVALDLVRHLLAGYGRDPRVTRLLDTRAFYVRPKFNPDGSDLALIHDQYLRSSVHPVDEDDDGRADEDPPSDLDGDGWITSMRIPDPRGTWYADPDDPRLMLRVVEEDGPPAGARRYRVMREGVDEDGDGLVNEDGVGGIDMNRNFPRNWERWHLQPGSGPFPLSEPETRATVEFLVAHPNVTGIVHGHTSGGFVYRLPSASNPELFPERDLELIEHLGAEYTRTTGRPVRPSSTHPTNHRYGTLISWGYWDGGMVGWVPEYSPGPEAWVTDYDGDGEISPAEEMRFNERELGGRYFSPWTRWDHPQLGEVEIGGWHTKFWGQNPPAEFLAEETEKQLPWILYLAEQSPLLVVSEPSVTPAGGGRVRVEATVRNTGFLPTSLTERGSVGRQVPAGGDATLRAGAILTDEDRAGAEGPVEVVDQVVHPPHVRLELRNAEVVAGTPRMDIHHLRGTGPFLAHVGPEEHGVSWSVRATGPGAAVRVVAESDKGGVARSGWVALR